MRLKPLHQWICDGCQDLIAEPTHGHLEWLALEEDHFKAHGFRIVHHSPRSPRRPAGNCYRYEERPGRRDMSLDTYVGSNGLPKLLMLLDPGPPHLPEIRRPGVRDVGEWVELFRRLHIPYYEEARLYWDRAEDDGDFDDANALWLYLAPRQAETAH
jgi:hypothetical protein